MLETSILVDCGIGAYVVFMLGFWGAMNVWMFVLAVGGTLKYLKVGDLRTQVGMLLFPLFPHLVVLGVWKECRTFQNLLPVASWIVIAFPIALTVAFVAFCAVGLAVGKFKLERVKRSEEASPIKQTGKFQRQKTSCRAVINCMFLLVLLILSMSAFVLVQDYNVSWLAAWGPFLFIALLFAIWIQFSFCRCSKDHCRRRKWD